MQKKLQIIQKQFNKFHDNIKLSPKDNQILREKRDKLAEEFQEWLDSNWDKLYPNTKKPTFDTFNQGSYAMGTGIKASKAEDHDIDVGFMFNIDKDDFKPEEVKNWVATALTKGGRIIVWKYPCIRVQYTEKGELSHHVDITCYAAPDYNNKKTYLAKAQNNTYPKKLRIWEETDPKSLTSLFKESEEGEDKKQRQRVLRGLKRWKDYNFNADNGRPIGIALTACALDWFQAYSSENTDTKKDEYCDLDAHLHLVTKMLKNFKNEKDESYERLRVTLDISPNNDLFEKMNQQQMLDFQNQLKRFKEALETAKSEKDAVKASEMLQKEFGDDFEVPEPTKDVASALKEGLLSIGVGTKNIISKPNGGFHGGKNSI